MAQVLVLAVLLPLATRSAAGDDLSKGAAKLLDSAIRLAKVTRLKEVRVRRFTEAMEKLSVPDLEQVIIRLGLRKWKKPPRSLPEVRKILVRSWGTRRFGAEAVQRFPDLLERIRSKDPVRREETLAFALRIEDLRLARDLALEWREAESRRVRMRAMVVLGDLLEYGVKGAGEVRDALLAGLRDLDPAVRAMACRRAFEARVPAIFDWALDHLGDDGRVEMEWRGEKVVLRPGEEALRGLEELTWIQRELTWRQYRRLSAEQKESLTELFTAWRKEKGAAFPPPGFREAPFDARPSTTQAVVVPPHGDTARFDFWSGIDRTRIRVALDEIESFAVTKYDFEVNFHLRYMAQGMRVDDGEAYRRHYPAGRRYVLARKVIGCYVLVFQPLLGDRVKVYLRFHDPL